MRNLLILVIGFCFACSEVVGPSLDASVERPRDGHIMEVADEVATPDADVSSSEDVGADVAIGRCEERPSRVVEFFPAYPVQFARTERGCLWVWGGGTTVQGFGRPDTPSAQIPELIPIPGHFHDVHRELSSICGIRAEDDTAWCWSSSGIRPIRYPQPVREIVTLYGNSARCVRLIDRTIWCTGRLGAIPEDFVTPRRIDELGFVDDLRACWTGPASFDVDVGLRVWQAPEPPFTLLRPPDAIADTCFHEDSTACYLTRGGTVQCVGRDNHNLVLGDPNPDPAEIRLREITNLTRITEVSGDSLRMAALRDDGTLWTWGRIDIRPTHPQEIRSHIPVQVGTVNDAVHMTLWRDTMLFVRRDGSVWKHSINDGDGPATNPQLRRVPLFGEP